MSSLSTTTPRAARPPARTLPRLHARAKPASVHRRPADRPHLPTAIAPPSADAPTTASPPSPAPSSSRPAYTKAWWPIAALDNLNPAVPNPLELMGEKLVAWKPSPDAAWVVQSDRCPHRAAPLTDGFISKSGDLVCAYHGYTFSSCGACTSIPALASDPKAEATARASKRACVRTLPTYEAAGLLFVWPDPASPTAAADAASAPPPPIPAVVADESILPLKNRWYARHLPFDLSFHLENVLDPGHAVFAHHNVAGMDARNAPAFTLEVSSDRGAAGFTLRQKMADPSKRASFIHFDAPSLVRYEPDPASGAAPPPAGTKTEARPGDPSGKLDTHLVFYAAPVRPGWTLLLGTSAIVDRATGAPSKMASIFGDALPAWLRHTLGHAFLAGDALSLARASSAYAAEGRNWRASYWMPSSADVGVVALRKWMETHGGGPDVPALPPAAAGVGVIGAAADTMAVTPSEVALAGAPPEVLLDRYTQHVQHCAACTKALATTRAVASRARACAIAAAAVALVLATAAAQAALSTAGAGAAVGWAPRAAAALVRATRGAPLAAVAACVAAAAVAALVARAARALERQFLYSPFDREKHKFA